MSPTPPAALTPASGAIPLSGSHLEASAGGSNTLESLSDPVLMTPALNGALLQANPLQLQPESTPVLLLQQGSPALLQLLQQANPYLLQQANPQLLQQANPQALVVTQGHPAWLIPAGLTAGPQADYGSNQAGQPAQAMSLQTAMAAAAASAAGQQQQHTGLPGLQLNNSMVGPNSSSLGHLGAFGTQQQQPQQATGLHALQQYSTMAGPSSSSQQLQQHHAGQPGPATQPTLEDIAAIH